MMQMQMFLAFLLIMVNLLKSKNHVLMLLLNLELLALILSSALVYLALLVSTSPLIIFSFLTLVVCEASLGLSVLIRLTRDWGSDFLK